MKIHPQLLPLPLLGFVLVAAVANIESNGAPAGHTNAPGELTCDRSGCHVGAALNSGTAALSVDLGSMQGYQPGVVYPITVRIEQLGRERFGFQMLALNDADTTNAGDFIATDSVRTKVITGTQQFAGRRYMTYRFPGTQPLSTGVGKWTFLWQAPLTANGPVSFYTAAAAANNDGTDQGDTIYTKVLTLPVLPVARTEAAATALSSTLYPNPSRGMLHLSYLSEGKGLTQIYLQSTSGAQRVQLLSRMDPPGAQRLTADLRGLIPSGSYLLVVKQGQRAACHPFVLLP